MTPGIKEMRGATESVLLKGELNRSCGKIQQDPMDLYSKGGERLDLESDI